MVTTRYRPTYIDPPYLNWILHRERCYYNNKRNFPVTRIKKISHAKIFKKKTFLNKNLQKKLDRLLFNIKNFFIFSSHWNPDNSGIETKKPTSNQLAINLHPFDNKKRKSWTDHLFNDRPSKETHLHVADISRNDKCLSIFDAWFHAQRRRGDKKKWMDSEGKGKW